MESLTTSVVVGGRYRLGAVLGEGGMARVFDAFDILLERPVAVKVLRPEADALLNAQQRFVQEARFAAQIHHPNVVAILDFGQEGGHSFLVMERLPGVTLRDEMARGPLPESRLVFVISEMLGALGAAHRKGVLHRDIKPSNVLLHDEGHTKLTDFGIAKSFRLEGPLPVGTDETMTGVVLGTPGYLAPERIAGRPASVQSDLYSVGALMVEACTGRRPAVGTDAALALPSSLRGVAMRALNPDPQGRFPSAPAMLEALHAGYPAARTPRVTQPFTGPVGSPPTAVAARATGASTVGMPPGPPRVPTPRRRHRALGAVALAAVAVSVLVASLFLLLEGTAETTGRGVAPPHPVQATTPAPPSTTAPSTTTTIVTTVVTRHTPHGRGLGVGGHKGAGHHHGKAGGKGNRG